MPVLSATRRTVGRLKYRTCRGWIVMVHTDDLDGTWTPVPRHRVAVVEHGAQTSRRPKRGPGLGGVQSRPAPGRHRRSECRPARCRRRNRRASRRRRNCRQTPSLRRRARLVRTRGVDKAPRRDPRRRGESFCVSFDRSRLEVVCRCSGYLTEGGGGRADTCDASRVDGLNDDKVCRRWRPVICARCRCTGDVDRRFSGALAP